MKHIGTFFFSLFFLFVVSCTGFLTEKSPNDIDTEVAIRDAASAEAALTGIYSSLQNRSYYGGQYPLMGEALSDNASTGGYSYISLDQLGAKNVTPANVLVEQMWIAIWRTTANCNYLLKALPDVTDLAANRKKDIEGQARALRAMAHFDALRYFGEHWNSQSAYGIPIIDAVQTIKEVPSRESVSNCYQFITKELETALGLLDRAGVSSQLINPGSTHALLARVYLFAGDKAKSAENADAVIADASYTLLPAAKYFTIFTDRRTTESVFELAFDAQNRSDYNNLTYSRMDAIRPELFYLAAKSLDDFFKTRSGDVRSALLNFDPAANDVTIVPDGRTQKYRGESTRDNPAYIIRLAEMYLIRAEAKGRTAGLADLNLVRTQRGLSELSGTDVPNDDAFINAVLAERRAEFHFEGHRYFDLARTGRLASVLGVDAFRAALPIPLREIAASGGKMLQTPGY